MARHGYPLILATSGRLGSINHTLLSLEAVRARGIELHSVAYNLYPPEEDNRIREDTREYIRDYLNTYFPQAGFQLIPCLP